MQPGNASCGGKVHAHCDTMSDSDSAPGCSSTLSSEHELTESTSGSGLPMRKKRKVTSGPGGKFKARWKLPQYITATSKGVARFDDSLLVKAKQCTRQRNLSYNQSKED